MIWKQHNGKTILVHEYISMSPEQIVPAIVANCDAVMALDKNDLCLLLNVSGSYVDRAVLHTFKVQGVRIEERVAKLAVFGLEPVHRYFLRLVSVATGIAGRPFTDILHAKNWLAE